MKNNEIANVSAPVPTEFGKMLRIERINRGMKSGKKMAEALGITASMLSEIENGKKEEYPDIDFLIRCRDFFGWNIENNDGEEIKDEKTKKTLELFEKGLLSSGYISINMNNFHKDKKQFLIKILMTLLFLPVWPPSYTIIDIENKPKSFMTQLQEKIQEISKQVTALYELLKSQRYTKEGEINNLPSPPPRKKITRNRKGKPPAQ